MNINTETYPLTARVWVYMADRLLDEEETIKLEAQASRFVQGWAAHGKDLNASAEVRYNRFLILMVDEAQNMASGCSIDASVHFVKEVGDYMKIDFFNRMLLAFRDGSGAIQVAKLPEISQLAKDGRISSSTHIFNNLVASKQSLDAEWEVPIGQSPYKRWL